ncbi:MAG: hydantoinase/oxoprolinase family protein [Acidimicrobiales bacterium]|nr:hydantoinase/oxoprolinase family protein [Acidimicrobiales bacterium]
MNGCGIDIGGTFTDAVVTSPEGCWTGKAETTPDRPAVGVLGALEVVAAKRGLSRQELISDLDQVVLGSTIGTNAVVERKTERAGLLTTHGFEDTLFVMRGGMGRTAGHRWDELGDPFALRKPRPLVARRDIRGISERTLQDGTILVSPTPAEILAATESLLSGGVKCLAVSFLWACRNPASEQMAKKVIAAEYPDLYVSCSSDVSSRVGEYERTVATVINAMLGPTNERLIATLEDCLRADGFGGTLFFLTSSGGVVDSKGANDTPVMLVGSGPAGGVAASAALAAEQDHPNAILCDMGGTTFDVGLIWKHSPLRRAEDVIDGYTFYRPSVDVVSVGAGGGSIAWVDLEGETPRLRVGPQSAGAVPGPACYGRGGMDATVTDANLVLGYIAAVDYFGPGRSLDPACAHRALDELGRHWGWDAEQTAANVIRVVNAQMADLIRQMTVQRGFDPDGFRMYAFGGGSPLHIGGIAKQLHGREAVIPADGAASVFSALGAATADIVRVFSATVGASTPWSVGQIEPVIDEVLGQAAELARQFGAPSLQEVVTFTAMVGYGGQVHALELPLMWSVSGGNDREIEVDLAERFFEWYDERFGQGFSMRGRRVELREVRCILRIARAVTSGPLAQVHGAADSAQVGDRRVWWPETAAWIDTPIMEGERLGSGETVAGPAIVTLERSAVLVHPGQQLTHSNGRALILRTSVS